MSIFLFLMFALLSLTAGSAVIITASGKRHTQPAKDIASLKSISKYAAQHSLPQPLTWDSYKD